MPPDSRAPSRQYPHVDGVTDWRAKQSLRLLWDRVADLGLRLDAAEEELLEHGPAIDALGERIDRIQQLAGEALSLAQRTAGESSGGSPGGPVTGPGSPSDPIVPMSADPTQAEADIKASLYHYGRADYSYWGTLVHVPGMAPWQGGDGKYYVGWNRYMEVRAGPGDTGSAGHDLLPLPANYTTPPPSGYPSGGWT